MTGSAGCIWRDRIQRQRSGNTRWSWRSGRPIRPGRIINWQARTMLWPILAKRAARCWRRWKSRRVIARRKSCFWSCPENKSNKGIIRMALTSIPEIHEGNIAEHVTKLRNYREAILQQVRRTIVGQDEAVNQVLVVLLVGGHTLITGLPGLAKTLL